MWTHLAQAYSKHRKDSSHTDSDHQHFGPWLRANPHKPSVVAQEGNLKTTIVPKSPSENWEGIIETDITDNNSAKKLTSQLPKYELSAPKHSTILSRTPFQDITNISHSCQNTPKKLVPHLSPTCNKT